MFKFTSVAVLALLFSNTQALTADEIEMLSEAAAQDSLELMNEIDAQIQNFEDEEDEDDKKKWRKNFGFGGFSPYQHKAFKLQAGAFPMAHAPQPWAAAAPVLSPEMQAQ